MGVTPRSQIKYITLYLQFQYQFCKSNAKVIKESDDYIYRIYYYSATEIESIAKSKFNIDDSFIAQLRTLTDSRWLLPFNYQGEWGEPDFIPIYDSATNTYTTQDKARGGYEEDVSFVYKKISDTEYIVYLNDYYAVYCTYNDTVKVSKVEYGINTPSDLIKFN